MASRHSFVIVVFVYLTHGKEAVIIGGYFVWSTVFCTVFIAVVVTQCLLYRVVIECSCNSLSHLDISQRVRINDAPATPAARIFANVRRSGIARFPPATICLPVNKCRN